MKRRERKNSRGLRSNLGFALGLAMAGLLIVKWWYSTPRFFGVHVTEVAWSPNDSPLRFFIFGDTGSGSSSQHAVAAALERRCETFQPSAVILLGDNFYMEGVVSVADPQWTEKFFSPYGGPCMSQRLVYPVLGNHDYRGNIKAQIEQSQIEKRWRLSNRFYGVNFGKLLYLTALDSNMVDWCLSPAFCLIDFWRQRLAHIAGLERRPWHISFAHHPIASSSAKHSNRKAWYLDWVLRRSICAQSDAYLAGHSHHLEHRKDEACDAEFFISGGGGADLYEVNKDPAAHFAVSSWGFLELEVSEDNLLWRFINADSQVLYEIKQVRKLAKQ